MLRTCVALVVLVVAFALCGCLNNNTPPMSVAEGQNDPAPNVAPPTDSQATAPEATVTPAGQPVDELKEPPFRLSPEDEPNGVVRAGMPVAPPTGEEDVIVYQIRYPSYRLGDEELGSKATIDVGTHAPLKEVFKPWVVIYDYTTQEDREARAPTTITVFRNAGDGNQGEQVNRYEQMFVDPDDLVVFYKDAAGHERQVAKDYFNMMPDPVLE